MLQGKNITQPVNIVVGIAEALSHKYSIPQVKKQKHVIEKVKETSFWEKTTIIELDGVKDALRDLIRYLDKKKVAPVYTNFSDTIIDKKEGAPIYAATDLQNYRQKVEFYLEDHKDTLAVYKLRHNKKLTREELNTLEKVLWEELGTRTDYEKEYGETPVGALVRRIVGVERDAVNQAFSEFMTEEFGRNRYCLEKLHQPSSVLRENQ